MSSNWFNPLEAKRQLTRSTCIVGLLVPAGSRERWFGTVGAFSALSGYVRDVTIELSAGRSVCHDVAWGVRAILSTASAIAWSATSVSTFSTSRRRCRAATPSAWSASEVGVDVPRKLKRYT